MVEIWIVVITIMTTLGFWLLLRIGLADVATVSTALIKRLRRRRIDLERRATAASSLNFETHATVFQRSPIVLGLIGGALLGSVWLASPIVAIWFIFCGGATGWIIQHSRSAGREDLRALELLISTLRSVFGVGQSIFNSLDLALENIEPSPLRSVGQETVRRYRTDLDASVALAVLRDLRWTYLSRLAVVFEQVGQSDAETIRSTLLDLEQRIRTARQIRDRANTVLTLSRLTLRVLQAANLMAVIAVTLLPTWRAFYSDNPFALIAVTGMVLAGSAYFATEMKRMEQAA
jgi:hypothetical protein